MLSKKKRKLIFIETFIIMILIYYIAHLINLKLDTQRTDFLRDQIEKSNINFIAYQALNLFVKERENRINCTLDKYYILNTYKKIKQFGNDLSNVGPLFDESDKNSSDLIIRRYFLDELKLYNQVLNYDKSCSDKIVPILYFYNSKSSKIDKQGLILDQVVINNRNKSIVLSFDYFYKNEPLLNVIKKRYQVDKYPFIVIGNKSERFIQHNQDNLLDLNVIGVEILKQRGEI